MKISDEMLAKFRNDPQMVKQANPLVLASVGDAVYSLQMRVHLASHGDMKAQTLHLAASKLVCAGAQAKAFEKICSFLDDDEAYIAHRGRNTHPGTVPKNASLGEYRIATALEAVFGFLYLLNRTERIETLTEIILENEV